MTRFIFWWAFFLVVVGLIRHLDLEVPFQWLGALPGDLVIKKGETLFYAPLTTSALLSLALSFAGWLLFKPSN